MSAFVWRKYRRKPTTIEMIEWHPLLDMDGVSVSAADAKAGSPQLGDRIARNPDNPNDQWLIAFDYFVKHYEVIE